MAKAKVIAGLDCSASADRMIPLVLRAQLKAMCALRDKALDWNDPEGVHDMRVRSRRLRSALSDFTPYLGRANLPRLRLKAIAKSLGAVRDQDVALVALEELKSKATGQAAEGIGMVIEERLTRRREARAALRRAIKRSAVEEFRGDFQVKLRRIAIVSRRKSRKRSVKDRDSNLPFSQVAREIIAARLKEFRDASAHLYFPFRIKGLHQLRILAKRLRYAIELFSRCGRDEFKAMAKEIALLQTSLGELHDCDVWIDSLGARLKETARKEESDEDKLRLKEGATSLLRHFTDVRMGHYRDALARWEQWEAEHFLERLESIVDRDLAIAPRSNNTQAGAPRRPIGLAAHGKREAVVS